MPCKKNDTCEKYGLAITDYVLGESMDITREELVNHLRSCRKCREDLDDWQNTYAVLRTKEYCSRPEVKAKMDAFIKELTTQPLPGKKPIDAKMDIDSAAGKIYDCLKTTGKLPRQTLREKTGLLDYPFYEALGWLVCQEKVLMSKDEQTVYVSLTERERQAGPPAG